ncbi:glycosyltransferase family 52 [Glaesserella parasuis]|nr:glycosyltransferase family 52 [Glaesserella parasuis]MDG6264743.1 glycosyltransferase family 52 [Glaesserella parasuis]MDG6369042.1 glycosyltransferase family 52 [Glaesserella parasuis]MDO9669721.1 glycosyltransferase family 52 [Glaesserella parasuis]
MLIAEKIIKQKSLKNCVLILVVYNDNPKFRYYYSRLDKLCEKSYFFLVDNRTLFNRIQAMFKLKILLCNLNKINFIGCYLASIDCSYIQLLTSGIRTKKIYTFDDGTVNFNLNGAYYKSRSYSLPEKCFRTLFSIHDTVESYRKKSALHYTIFKNTRNIIENTEYISLINDICSTEQLRTKTVKIFVGQPLFEIKVKKETILAFLKQERIEYYYPHPREIEKFENITYLNSEKIFEDYIMDYLAQNPTHALEIYTFFSTAVLTIKDIKGISIVSCYTEEIDPKHHAVYAIFREMNIPIMNLG